MVQALFISVVLSAQVYSDINSQLNLPKMTPVSPNAAALGKYGEIPVSYYTGIPNTSIPLYVIKTGDIELPISLDYHGGGIKVEEMASWVGLGWSLSCGGTISRTVRGEPDVGAFSGATKVEQFHNNQMTQGARDSFLVDVYNRVYDAESDIYFFNGPGFSGKFFITNDGKFFTSPRSDIKIEFMPGGGDGWKLTTGQGVQYLFQSYETTYSTPFSASTGSGYTNGDQSTTITSWLLDKITDSKGNTITFSYENGGETFRTKMVSSKNLLIAEANGSCPPDFSWSYNENYITDKVLKEINFSNGKISFQNTAAARLDSGVIPLKKMIITNSNSDTLKSFHFFTSYFATDTTGGCEDNIHYRLRLDSLSEHGMSNDSVAPYKFYYNSTSLPCRLSNAQDYWGYYNGKHNATFVRYQNSQTGPWVGANKDPDPAYAKACVLEKIEYPTGGSSEFEYEGNTNGTFIYEGFAYSDSTLYTSLSGNNTGASNYLVTLHDTITVNSGDLSSQGYLLLKAHKIPYCENPELFNQFTLTIYNNAAYNRTVNDNDTVHLGTGTYYIQATIETEFAATPYCQLNTGFFTIPYKNSRWENTAFGGIRIKRIINKALFNAAADTQRFAYNFVSSDSYAPDTVSSGAGSPLPDYIYEKNSCPIPGSPPCCYHRIYSSISNYPLTLAGGKPLGYHNVTLFLGENGENGKKEFTYTSNFEGENQDALNAYLPYPPPEERDWRRGLLVKEKTYAKVNNSFEPVQTKIIKYEYHSADTTKKYARGLKLGKITEYPGISGYDWILAGLRYAEYLTVAEAFNISSDTSVIYSQYTPNETVTGTSDYVYTKNNFQLRQKRQTSSKGDTITTKIYYPLDFSVNGSGNDAAKGIYKLQQLNIISRPVELFNTVKPSSGSEYVLNGVINVFKPTQPVPDTVFSFETLVPVTLSSYSQASINGAGNFVKDSNYLPGLAFLKYDTSGNVIVQKKVNDVNGVYIWDYKNSYVTAEILGADSASVAYSSFEAENKGGWAYSGSVSGTYSITGHKSYNTSGGNITKSGLSNTTYIVSYWGKSGSVNVNGSGPTKTGKTIGNWTYYEHEITSTSVTISGSNYIDELRLYPKGALMSTYTYTPLLGITSQCDISNKIMYYEYDNFNRLKLIKDEDGKILKIVDYKYQQHGQN